MAEESKSRGKPSSLLGNWPIKIKLVPPRAPFFEGADLVISADCAPFALANLHQRFLEGKVLLIGCPKLDDQDFYLRKLTQIFTHSEIRSIAVVFMEVPCCFGLVHLVREAVDESGKDIPITLHRVGTKGEIVEVEGEPGGGPVGE
ncbi:MAG: hypothetical protein PHO53_07080 [Actinomycetota bacterium]|nr:hypothetical protein [Actinomycetota bacterium]